MWLVAASEVTEVPAHRVRDLRRFNAPIQLAVAAAHEVLAHAVAPSEAALISLAPCQSGSPELHDWIRKCASGTAPKVNPTWTLHAVDNLALSVLAIAIANHAWGRSLGGAAGMVWTALEMCGERGEQEVVVLGGDQQTALQPSPGTAFAMLFAREKTPFVHSGRPARLLGVERTARRAEPSPHAAAPALAMLAALRDAPVGRFTYAVPPADGDGHDAIAVHWEVCA